MGLKKQKRFTSSDEILAEIDRLKQSQHAKVKKAEVLTLEKRRLMKMTLLPENERPSLKSIEDDIGFNNKKIRMLGRTAELIETKKIPRLKDAPAAMRTETFAFNGDDKGVVLTK